MKIALSGLLLFYSSIGSSCESNEALVSATITNITKVENDKCIAYISHFNFFQGHKACPLSQEKVWTLGISINGSQCAKNIGESIDGVIIDLGDRIILD